MNPIAIIHSCYKEKFATPRQSGLVSEATAQLIFEKPYRNEDAVRGLEGFSHIWLIWKFHLAERATWSPTVRPPRLGGNTRMGVFATRSPFRPNPLGLSAVKLEHVELHTEQGPILHLSGIDLIDGTPIYDIKPYITFADSIPHASAGFATSPPETLEVIIPPHLQPLIPREESSTLTHSLALDPRPSYHDDDTRVYGATIGSLDVKFTISGNTLTITSIAPLPS